MFDIYYQLDSIPSRSQSRMRGDYLYYEEKIEITAEEKDAKAARRFAFSNG